jgi:HK97 family phage major capsid protein
MTNITDLKRQKSETIRDMRRIVDNAEDEKRDLTPAESKRYDELDRAADSIDKKIIQAQKMALRDAEFSDLSRIVNPLPDAAKFGGSSGDWRGSGDETGGFRNIGELFVSIAKFKRDGVRDERLDGLRELREQTMGTGATGGFALPRQFDGALRQVAPGEAAVRPRATVIPAGSPPDAPIDFPSLDQTSAQNMFGGVIITHTGEGVTMTEATMRLKEVTLEPKELSAYIVCTQKLLNNWMAASAIIGNQLKTAVNAAEDFDFIRGDGINKALGFINSAAAITYSRATPNSITFPDILGMAARFKLGGKPCWIASPTTIAALYSMVDTGNHNVLLGGGPLAGAAGPAPQTLLGFEIVWSDRLPPLGTKGDLCLCDLTAYCVKDGSMIAASSEHIFFLSNKVAFKVVWNVDGRPWLTEPITLEGSATSTVSPFVILSA